MIEPYYESPEGQIYQGDCRKVMQVFPENHFTTVITDPPYELGFMGKKWDSTGVAFQVETWVEILRICKPGAILMAFGGTRTSHRLVCAIEDAGWEIRDSIMWIYGSGFPKSHNIGKNIEKIKVGGIKNLKQIGTRGGLNNEDGTHGFSYSKEYVPGKSIGGKQLQGEIPIYEINNEWEGYGTALKPAHEDIVLAMKPLDGTFANNALVHGVAGLNIDAGRVGYIENDRILKGGTYSGNRVSGAGSSMFGTGGKAVKYGLTPKGRWPANIILSHHPDCECVGVKKVKNTSGSVTGKEPSKPAKNVYGEYGRHEFQKHGDLDGTETVEAWNCHPDCPIAIMDGQAGDCSSTRIGNPNNPTHQEIPSQLMSWGGIRTTSDYRDAGGPSRFFYTAKASRSERGKDNDHPTVKPVALIRYLVELTAPPKDALILDPFFGSGTLGVVCEKLGIEYVGIDLDCRIARERIKRATSQLKLFRNEP